MSLVPFVSTRRNDYCGVRGTSLIGAEGFETLLALIERQGQLLEKDTLLQMLWPDRFVEEANLTVKISQFRKALGEHPQALQYIVTVPGRGYRFVAEIRTVGWTELEMEIKQQVPPEVQLPQGNGWFRPSSENDRTLSIAGVLIIGPSLNGVHHGELRVWRVETQMSSLPATEPVRLAVSA